MGENLNYLGFGKDFLNMTKAQLEKKKSMSHFIKIKTFLFQKTLPIKMKKKAHRLEEISVTT